MALSIMKSKVITYFFSSYFKVLGISRPHVGLQRGCFSTLRREDWGRSSTKGNEQSEQPQTAFKLGVCVRSLVQSRVTLRPCGLYLPDCSGHWIPKARILQWVAMPSYRLWLLCHFTWGGALRNLLCLSECHYSALLYLMLLNMAALS